MNSRKKVLWKIFISTLYLSAFTFGGGYVIVSLMKKKFVDELHWVEEKKCWIWLRSYSLGQTLLRVQCGKGYVEL